MQQEAVLKCLFTDSVKYHTAYENLCHVAVIFKGMCTDLCHISSNIGIGYVIVNYRECIIINLCDIVRFIIVNLIIWNIQCPNNALRNYFRCM